MLAVDNVSDIGRGRLVVSYDASQTAIVWDLMTGEEVARFVSYEHLTCASWMRSGNVAFGRFVSRIDGTDMVANNTHRQRSGLSDTIRADNIRASLFEDA